jgi:Ca-activated chloride channel family protein
VDDLVFARASLWPVLLVPLVILGVRLWGAAQRRSGLRALGDARLVGRLVATVHRRNRVLEAVFVTLAGVLLAVALLRPQFGGTARVVAASGVDIVLAVDYSKSMLAKDVYPSRSERLEAELARFLDDVRSRGDRVGVVVFAGEARGLPVSRDARIAKLYLDRADPRSENPGGTAIGKALRLALLFLADARAGSESADAAEPRQGSTPASEAEQVIVLLTDGEDNASRPLELAEEAARLGVRIYTVGIGSRSGEPIQTFDAEGKATGYVTDEAGNYVMTRLDAELLQALATKTGGKFIHVEPERFGLDAIRAELAALSASEGEDQLEIHRDEGFPWLVLPAFGLLVLALALPDRRKEARS